MQEKEHGRKVATMFNRISGHYDLLNRLMSGFQDMRWRRRAVELLGDLRGESVLDLCCGTGDFLRIFSDRSNKSINMYGLDFSHGMLLGAKAQTAHSRDYTLLIEGDALALPFRDNSIAAVTIGFGIRNIKDRPAALKEILRVLSPGGRLIMIEPAIPSNPLIGIPFVFYFKYIMPLIGGLISGNFKAYQYLDKSVMAFPASYEFVSIMESCGLENCRAIPQAMGTAMIYYGEKSA